MFKWNESFQAKLDELIMLNEKGKIEGEYKDIPLEVYHHPLCPGLSKTALRQAITFNRLTQYLKKRLLQIQDPEWDPTPTGDKLIGSAVHDLLFERPRFNDLYCKGLEIPNFGDKRKKANKDKYEEWTTLHHGPWLEANKGRVVLTPDEWIQVQDMAIAALANPDFQRLLDGAEFEMTYFYRCPKTGALLKSRPDITNKKKRLAYDHKTTNDAEVSAFKRTAKNFSYDLQISMQIDGVNQIIGGEPFLGLWGAQDRDEAPYDMAFYTPDDPTLDGARNWLVERLKYLEMAKQGGASKGYHPGVMPIGITGWVLT